MQDKENTFQEWAFASLIFKEREQISQEGTNPKERHASQEAFIVGSYYTDCWVVLFCLHDFRGVVCCTQIELNVIHVIQIC